MAYVFPWDETYPAGSSDAATLDTIIQNVLKTLRERLEDPFPDWTDDAVDPKRIVVHSGLLDDRPAEADANAGEIYIATDTIQAYFFDGTSWNEFDTSGGAGTYVRYDDNQAAGSKVLLERASGLVANMVVSGNTDGSGDLVVDASEIDLMPTGGWTKIDTILIYPDFPSTCFKVHRQSTTASQLTLRFLDHANAAVASQAVIANIWVSFYTP